MRARFLVGRQTATFSLDPRLAESREKEPGLSGLLAQGTPPVTSAAPSGPSSLLKVSSPDSMVGTGVLTCEFENTHTFSPQLMLKKKNHQVDLQNLSNNIVRVIYSIYLCLQLTLA